MTENFPRPHYASTVAAGACLIICLLAALALAVLSRPLNDGQGERPPIPPVTRAYSDETIRLGLIEFDSTVSYSRDIDRTIEELRRVLAPRQLEFRRWRSADLESAILSGRVDFFVASAGFYQRMTSHGAVSLATKTSPLNANPNRGNALTMLVRRDSPYQTLSDLRGERLAASYRSAFIGYRIGMAEIALIEPDWEHFFRETRFMGSPRVPPLVSELEADRADVIFVPACALEALPEEHRQGLRAINVLPQDDFPCEVSSKAYPGHTFAAMKWVPPELARVVAATLLTMPFSDHAERWGVATDFASIDELYKLLRIGPYEWMRQSNIRIWLSQHAVPLYLLLLLIAGLAGHSLRSDWLVRATARKLTVAYERENAALRQLDELSRRLEKTQKSVLVAQFSSMVAHELAQPLAAVSYYAEAVNDLLAATPPDRAALKACRDKLAKQNQRAIAIVDKVRHYIRAGQTKSDTVPLAPLLESLLRTLRHGSGPELRVSLSLDPGLTLSGDPLELELLLWNLLKNAAQAASDSRDPELVITAASKEGRTCLEMRNSGRIISADELGRILEPLTSGPGSAGLGLGIGIARSIAEKNGGGVDFYPQPGGGMLVSLRLPDGGTPRSETDHD